MIDNEFPTSMIRLFQPQHSISRSDVRTGLNMAFYETIGALIMGSLTGGPFLVAFALMLGASNVVIGMMAAIGPLSQILQIPAVILVEKTRHRKAVVIATAFISRTMFIFIALVPLLFARHLQVPFFFLFLFVFFGFAAIAGCAYNSWMRDFVPEKIMGSFFGRRLAAGTAAASALGLVAALLIDQVQTASPNSIWPYSALFIGATLVGAGSVAFFLRCPEPIDKNPRAEGFWRVLAEPLHDRNFRSLLIFLGSWNFAVNLAAPFFTVYLLKRLELSLTMVMVLTVFSQMMNVLFFRIWGRMSDRLGNKSVLSVAGWLFIISIILYPFTTMPERWVLTIPLLILIHALAGISTAGVVLCAGNMALKISPKGKATAYLATNAFVSGVAATIAPLLAGLLAEWFYRQQFRLVAHWEYEGFREYNIAAFDVRGLDFLFVIAFLLGLYALHRLLAVKEQGEVKEQVVYMELYGQARKVLRHISTAADLRELTHFPYSYLMKLIGKTSRKDNRRGES